MVRASALGCIDFKACDDTSRWWTGARLRLRAVDQELRLRVLELTAHRAIQVQSMPDLGQKPAYRQEFAIEAVEAFQDAAMPWFAAARKQNDMSEDAKLDAIALWYLEYYGGLRTDDG